jgi:hypothetical protein
VSRRQPLAAAILALVTLFGATGCTSSAGSGDAVSEGTGPRPAASPTLAGGGEAQALAGLPDGAATGTAVLAYAGVGVLRAPFTGACSGVGDDTRLEGTADSAQIRLDVTPDGARLALDDLGFSATSDLTTGRYDVEGNHLDLVADLAQDGMTVGSVELEVDCGG